MILFRRCFRFLSFLSRSFFSLSNSSYFYYSTENIFVFVCVRLSIFCFSQTNLFLCDVGLRKKNRNQNELTIKYKHTT